MGGWKGLETKTGRKTCLHFTSSPVHSPTSPPALRLDEESPLMGKQLELARERGIGNTGQPPNLAASKAIFTFAATLTVLGKLFTLPITFFKRC